MDADGFFLRNAVAHWVIVIKFSNGKVGNETVRRCTVATDEILN